MNTVITKLTWKSTLILPWGVCRIREQGWNSERIREKGFTVFKMYYHRFKWALSDRKSDLANRCWIQKNHMEWENTSVIVEDKNWKTDQSKKVSILSYPDHVSIKFPTQSLKFGSTISEMAPIIWRQNAALLWLTGKWYAVFESLIPSVYKRPIKCDPFVSATVSKPHASCVGRNQLHSHPARW